MLNDISAVPGWEKVTTGLMKMFMEEVIGKHPVIKHLKFGSLLKFP
jgi:serine/threonine-protein phosphatase 2A activator